MKLSEFETLTYKELNNMDVDALRQIASEQGKKLNKRISRIISNKKVSHIAVDEVMSSGGKFNVRKIAKGGENEKSALISEIKREQKFQKAKSGTVRGAKKLKESIQKATGKTAREYGKEKSKEYEKKEKARLKAKSKTGKLTKAQVKRIRKQAKRIKEKEEKAYDNAVGEGWDVFHRWREEHPNVSYAKESVKSGIDEYVSASLSGDSESEDIKSNLHDLFTDMIESQPPIPDVWSTVNENMRLPFI